MEVITRPDMSTMSVFSFVPIQKIFSCILIPENIDHDSKITIIDKNNNKKYKQSLILTNKNLTIKNNKYIAINIAPGLSVDILEKSKLALLINNNEYVLNIGFTDKYIPQLIIGQIILSDNYLYRFNAEDTIQLFCDEKLISGKLLSVKNKFNYYVPNKITSLLDIVSENNLYLNYFIHQNLNNKIYVRSLTTKQNYNLGSILIKTNNQHNQATNNDIKEYKFNNILEILNLKGGKYEIKVLDQNQNTYYNNIVEIPFFFEKISTQSSLLLFNKNNQQKLIEPI